MTKVAICPTVTAFDTLEYKAQLERLVPFAKRIHIDLMDGKFAPTLSPDLDTVWWPKELVADIHLMYQNPMDYVDQLIKLKPNLVVIHYEADVNHLEFAGRLNRARIKAGLAILHDTPVEAIFQIMHSFDHLLVFSGHLGYHGGQADLSLTAKVSVLREHCPQAEIGWDGGINDKNTKQLVESGVNVLNVGGYIAHATDPQAAYAKLESVI